MARKNYYGSVDVPEPSAGASIPDAAASAAAAAAAKKDKAENAKIFTEGKPLPVDLTEKTKDTKPKGFAKGGSVTRGDGCAQRGKTKGKIV